MTSAELAVSVLLACQGLIGSALLNSDSGACNPRWRRYRSKCYKIMNEDANHTKSIDQCQKMQASLVYVFDTDTANFLSRILRLNKIENAWVGSKSVDSKWTWSNCKLVEQMGNGSEFEGCLSINANSSFLVPKTCSSLMPYICQMDSFDCADGKWSVLADYCTRLFKKETNWVAAKSHCMLKGGNLIIADTNGIHQKIGTLLQSLKGIWIGLAQVETYADFVWVDNGTIQETTARWHPHAPKSEEQCVMYFLIENKPFWIKTNCNQTQWFMCQKIYPRYNMTPPPVVEWESCAESSVQELGITQSSEISGTFQVLHTSTLQMETISKALQSSDFDSSDHVQQEANSIRTPVMSLKNQVMVTTMGEMPHFQNIGHSISAYSKENITVEDSPESLTAISYLDIERSSPAISFYQSHTSPANAFQWYISQEHLMTALQTASNWYRELPVAVASVQTFSTDLCTCPCTHRSVVSIVPYTPDPVPTLYNISHKLEQIVNELRVEKKNLSSHIRRRTSAPDERLSSKIIGSTAVVLMLVPLYFIVLIDLPRIIHHFQFLISLCKRKK